MKKLKKKERANHVVCSMLHRKRKEKKLVVRKAGWHHNKLVSWVFEFVGDDMYLLNLYWQQQGRERKREKVRVSIYQRRRQVDFSNNSKFATRRLCYFITITYQILSIYWFILFRFWNILIWIIKTFYIEFNRHYWQVYSSLHIIVNLRVANYLS